MPSWQQHRLVSSIQWGIVLIYLQNSVPVGLAYLGYIYGLHWGKFTEPCGLVVGFPGPRRERHYALISAINYDSHYAALCERSSKLLGLRCFAAGDRHHRMLPCCTLGCVRARQGFALQGAPLCCSQA